MLTRANYNLWKNRAMVITTAMITGWLVTACSERPKEADAAVNNSACASPSAPVKLFSTKFDPATKQGWTFNGPSFSGQNKDVPMGRFENQLVIDLAAPAGATAAWIKLPVSATVPTATIILDTIWFNGLKALGSASLNMELGKVPGNAFNSTQPLVAGADRLTLVARPYREVDGVLTVAEGELRWCMK